MSSGQILPRVDSRDLLAEQAVAIYGLGLMGGSLAMALRGRAARIFGIDPDPNTRQMALRNQIVDEVYDFPPGNAPQPNLIILAANVQTNLQILAQLPVIHTGPAIILDLGSTKRTTLGAMEMLPERFNPIGGHPMCGKETAGLVNASGELYQQAAFALCPLPRTSPHALAVVRAMVAAIGARPYWLDAETHDRWVAATSHLPYLVSNTLAAVTPEDAEVLIGPGFVSTSRLGSSNLDMMLDILKSNRVNILTALANYAADLHHLAGLLELEDYDNLKQKLQDGARRRQLLVAKNQANPK